jgi:DNA-binding transcriptional LysR family regulator
VGGCAGVTSFQRRYARLRPKLNLLLALEALLEEQNVTRAAARLHISQPALSSRLARLRDLFCDAMLLPARRGVVASPGGGGCSGSTDEAVAAEGLRRKVVLSAAHFMFVPEIVAKSDLIALVPARMARGMKAVQVFEPPLVVRGFQIAMFWHDKTHAHPGHQWLRERIVATLANHSTDGRP